MVLQERYIWLGGIRFREELGVRGDAHRRSLHLSPVHPLSLIRPLRCWKMQTTYLLDDPLLRGDGVAILKLMLGEVDVGKWALVLDLVYGLLDLRLGPTHHAAAARRSVVWGDRRDSGDEGMVEGGEDVLCSAIIDALLGGVSKSLARLIYAPTSLLIGFSY